MAFDLKEMEKRMLEKLKPRVSLIQRLRESAKKPRLPRLPKL